MQAKFFTVNTELHSVHTVRPGSKTERMIDDAIGTREKLRIKIAGQQHLVFRDSAKALAYLELIRLDGHQGRRLSARSYCGRRCARTANAAPQGGPA